MIAAQKMGGYFFDAIIYFALEWRMSVGAFHLNSHFDTFVTHV